MHVNKLLAIGIVTGIGWNQAPNGPCIGNTSPVSSIGYPSLCLHDGPLGVRWGKSITAFTPAVQAASTWDVELIRQRGAYLAAEFKGTGVNVILGPAPGALGKNAEGGRNWEGFAPDPYLQGIASQVTVEALQAGGVQATAKHFIVNEQEINREQISSNVDDRTMHELYLWPFADTLRANVAAVMCSYNRVNGTHACENSGVLNDLLKTELGFPGYVMSDWFVAQQTTSGAANAGMDMSMPGSGWGGGDELWGPKLQAAIDAGEVEQSRLEDMGRRILAGWYLLGQDGGYPPVNIQANVQANHAENVRACARDGTVLLKNEDAILPLKAPGSIAVIGSSSIQNPNGINSCVDQGCNEGALGMGWGSGAVEYPYLVAPLDAIKVQAAADGTDIVSSTTDDTAAGARAATGADVALVFITANSGEGYLTVEGNVGDRNNLDPWNDGNELVAAVAAVNDNVVVVVHSTGAVILERILALPSVKAVVWGGLPSQENGNAVVDIVWGSTNPNGKLPYTIAKSENDYSSKVIRNGGDDNFSEGLYVDYRHFDAQNIEPRFEFGFGLLLEHRHQLGGHWRPSALGETGPGGRIDLFDDVAEVTATITNTGEVAGAEVAQCVHHAAAKARPATPPQAAARISPKLKLAAGRVRGTGDVSPPGGAKDLSYWDVTSQNWIVPQAPIGVKVARRAGDIRLEARIEVTGGPPRAARGAA
ncbi:beta-glucosidase [Verticillium alfalfae VaMs.102]|uniref:Beta-glucosidase cel3A n=1 Tax=Verticillium alfalfae (strain VaMs.102 / ATCC MYA-4576 / FGSC 10136) TaxID=526221 RepID=C9SUH2_VERA1|nr:beta-glucosidase [Verticillium alfalfae VaMs.102]EEY22483.1 beta-glucosidase [Verticillium alfalfae VaMs.102]